MRIIAGTARGLKLNTIDGIHTRPTADRVKEALFSSLSDKLRDSVVLDAFAGSGALGIESLSRGAKRAVLCENAREAFSISRKNISKAHFEDRAELMFTDALSYVKKKADKFDIIFLDPPYASKLYEAFLNIAMEILLPGGIIIVEFEDKNRPEFPDFYTITKEKRYGRVCLSYLIVKDEKNEDCSNSGKL